MILSQAFKKYNFSGGCRGERIIERSSILPWHVRELGHHEAFKEFKVLSWILLMIRSHLQPPELLFLGKLLKDPQQDPP